MKLRALLWKQVQHMRRQVRCSLMRCTCRHSSQPGGWLKDLNLENEIDGQVCRQAWRKVKQVPLQHSDQLKPKHTAHSQQPAMQAAAKWPQSMQAAPAGAALTAWPSRSARVLLWASWTAGSFGSTPKKLQGRGWGKAGHVQG
jgi:hypothetical protein